MLELSLDRLDELLRAKDFVISTITRALFLRRSAGVSNFVEALRESEAALKSKSFNNHVPQDEDVWTLISSPISRAVDFERERLLLLAHLLPNLMQVVASDYQLAAFAQLFELEPA